MDRGRGGGGNKYICAIETPGWGGGRQGRGDDLALERSALSCGDSLQTEQWFCLESFQADRYELQWLVVVD